MPIRLRAPIVALAACSFALAACQLPELEEEDDPPKGSFVLNDNGGWCWYQNPRAIIDPATGKAIVGSVATAEGPGGEDRSGDVDLVTFDLGTHEVSRITLDKLITDDHDAPSLLIRQDGRYLAMYSNHNVDKRSWYRVSTRPHDASSFEPTKIFDWSSVHSDYRTTYANLIHLSAENLTYDFTRADNRSPNILTSTDDGDTWTFRGNLTHSETVGYVNGYFLYASNDVDRIDFVATEHHPRDYDTSIYHGVLMGGKARGSDGHVVDDDIFDDDAREPAAYTQVFKAGTRFNGEPMTHAWPCDIKLDALDRPQILFTARANDVPENTNFDDHRFFHARWDGERWHVHEIAKAGPRLFHREEDYTGLASFDPDDLSTIYLSSNIDPRDGVTTRAHEIYQGVTEDGGETWTWTPITTNSTVNNIRPVIPRWDGEHTLLLWLRGTMRKSQIYDQRVMGKFIR